MTTVNDSRFLLEYLKFWSKVYIFPYEVIAMSGKIVTLSFLKKGLWNVLYLLSFLHAMYTFTHLIVTLIFFQENLVVNHLPVQFVGAFCPLLFYLSYQPPLISNPHALKIVFNELFSRQGSEGFPRKWRELNFLELLGIYGMPALMASMALEYFIIICLEPSMSHLIINIGLFKQFKNNIVFIALVYFCEAFSNAMWFIHCSFFLSILCNVIFKVASTMEGIESSLTRRCWFSTSNIHKSLSTFRRIQLYLQIFNIVNKWYLQIGKLICVVAAIVGAVFGLRYQSQLLVSVICIYCYVGSCVVYCVSFTLGFSASDSQQRAKRALMIAGRNIRDEAERREVVLTIRSLPCTGLKCGEFHEIEQNSAFVFLDYVHAQIIDLLLVF